MKRLLVVVLALALTGCVVGTETAVEAVVEDNAPQQPGFFENNPGGPAACGVTRLVVKLADGEELVVTVPDACKADQPDRGDPALEAAKQVQAAQPGY